MIVKNLLLLIPLSLLVACDWVDSTGRESNSAPVAEPNSAPVAQITIADGQRSDALALDELNSLDIAVSATDADGEIKSSVWLPEPVEQGALDQCAGVAGFDIGLAAATLASACSSASPNCVVAIERPQDDNVDSQLPVDVSDVNFMVNAPSLRAPVGVTYQLNTTDNEGGTSSQLSTFCLIAINDPPEAVDDSFTVLEGQILSVTAASIQNLLSNDVQDDHVANTNLQIEVEPATAPMFASAFSLGSDGGFTYTAPPLARGDDQVADTFVYSVTDGTHVSTATVTVNVVAINDAPEQADDIPLQEFVVGVGSESDLSQFFTDEEGSALSFVIANGSLPASGALSLSAAGILSGTADVVDEGSYLIEIIVSDGVDRITAEVDINVVANSPVDPTAIARQEIELGETLELDLSDFFNDEEKQPLTYSATVTDPFNSVTIDVDEETGEFEAEFSEVGQYFINVIASDGITPPANISIVAIVTSDNVAPIFSGLVLAQSGIVGTAITPIDFGIRFTDDNDDALTFTVSGALPDGITLTTTGTLRGTPTEAGNFRRISVIATDPLGETAQSNLFQIQITPAPLVLPLGSTGN